MPPNTKKSFKAYSGTVLPPFCPLTYAQKYAQEFGPGIDPQASAEPKARPQARSAQTRKKYTSELHMVPGA